MLRHIQRQAQGGNAPGLKGKIYVGLMTELVFGDILPDPNPQYPHLIESNIPFRRAAANVEAGGCFVWEITKKKNSFKLNGKNEGGHTYYEPTLEVMMDEMSYQKASVFNYVNGADLFLGFADNNGKMRIATNVTLFADGDTDDNTNAYKLKFQFETSSREPYYYTGVIPIKE